MAFTLFALAVAIMVLVIFFPAIERYDVLSARAMPSLVARSYSTPVWPTAWAWWL